MFRTCLLLSDYRLYTARGIRYNNNNSSIIIVYVYIHIFFYHIFYDYHRAYCPVFITDFAIPLRNYEHLLDARTYIYIYK